MLQDVRTVYKALRGPLKGQQLLVTPSLLTCATCPSPSLVYDRLELLLSGFDAHGPNSDAVPSTVPAKRPADTHAEYRSQRLKMEDASKAVKGSPSASASPPAIPRQPPIPYTFPTVPPVMTLDSTTQSPVREPQRITDDQPVWSGKLIWSCGGSEVDAAVQATDPIRNLCVHFLI